MVLAPRSWCQVRAKERGRRWQESPVAGESTKQPLKPLRREGRTASAEPVCSCALLFATFARETAGAARTRSSPRPLRSMRVRSMQASDALRREKAEVCTTFSIVIPGCAIAHLRMRPLAQARNPYSRSWLWILRFDCQTARGCASAFSRRDAPELCVDCHPR